MQAQLPCFNGLYACGSNLMIPSQAYSGLLNFISQVIVPPESPFADPNSNFEVVPDGDNCYSGSGSSGSAGEPAHGAHLPWLLATATGLATAAAMGL